MPVTIDKMKAVFLAALDKTTDVERLAFLDETCADEVDLRHSVEALLRAHEKADPLLDRPAAEHLETSNEDTEPDDSLDFLSPPSRPDSLGRIGHYEILEVLGRGGFGIVLRAFDDSLQRIVAVKVLSPLLAGTSPARTRFLREARSSAQIRHENVVQVYAVEEQPLPYLVMEFIPGETLQERLDRSGPLESFEVVQIGRQLAEGLAAAHAMGLIHRDIKPANILIEADSNEHVKITDFGLARTADDASLTQSGMVAGTPMFMAPEQASGDTLDHRADLFSLGSVLYTMCSGRPPFRAGSTLAVLRRVAEDTPRPIPEIIPEVPQWICDIIERLHSKKPDDRIGTAKEVADLFALGPLPTQSAEAASEIRRSRFGTRFWVATAVILLMLIGGLGLTETTGVTNLRSTVIRLFSPEGTLIVEVDDPEVSVKIDGSELVITGAGAKEIRLKPGKYTVEASKDGKVVSRELVRITNNGRQIVRIRQVASPPVAKTPSPAVGSVTDAYIRRIAALPATEQVAEVRKELMRRNPDFKGDYSRMTHKIEGNVVTEFFVVGLQADQMSDISPIRAFVGLKTFTCWTGNSLLDLSPLKSMQLTSLQVSGSPLTDLSPLKDLKLTTLSVEVTSVRDLSPLKDNRTLRSLILFQTSLADLSQLKNMKLTSLNIGRTGVTDLSPLKHMKLKTLLLKEMPVSDLSPLRGMPLEVLNCKGSRVTDLAPLENLPLRKIDCDFQPERDAKILRAIETLETINGKPVAEFWKKVDAKTKD